jgi:hypothetical protein
VYKNGSNCVKQTHTHPHLEQQTDRPSILTNSGKIRIGFWFKKAIVEKFTTRDKREVR